MDSQIADSLHVERRGATTIITLDRPEVRNAVNGTTAKALHEAFLAFERMRRRKLLSFTEPTARSALAQT